MLLSSVHHVMIIFSRRQYCDTFITINPYFPTKCHKCNVTYKPHGEHCKKCKHIANSPSGQLARNIFVLIDSSAQTLYFCMRVVLVNLDVISISKLTTKSNLDSLHRLYRTGTDR